MKRKCLMSISRKSPSAITFYDFQWLGKGYIFSYTIKSVLACFLFVLVLPGLVPEIWAFPNIFSKTASKITKDSYDELIKKNIELKEKADGLIKEQGELEGEYGFLLERLKALQVENAALLKEKNGLIFILNDRAAKIEDLSKGLSELQVKFSVSEKFANEKDSRIRRTIEKEYQDKYKNTISSLKSELQNAQSELKDKKTKAGGIEKTLSNESKKAQRLEQRASQLENELTALNTANKAQEGQIKGLERQIADFQIKQQKAAKAALDEKVFFSLQNKAASLEKQNTEMNRELGMLKKASGEKENDIYSLNLIIGKLKASLDAAKNENDKKLSENISLNARIKVLEKEITSMDKSSRALEEKLQAAISELKDKEKQANEEKDRADTFEKKTRDLSADLLGTREKLQGEISNADNFKKEMDKELKAMNNALTAKEKQAQDMLNANNTVKAELSKSEKKAYELESVRDKSEESIKKLEAELDALSGYNKGYAEKVRAFKNKLNKIISELIQASNSGKKQKDAATRIKESLTIQQDVYGLSVKEKKELQAENKRLESDARSAGYARKAAERKAEAIQKKMDDMRRGIDKERLNMHYNLAVMFAQNNRYRDAEREYKKCLEIDPNDAGVHYNLGIIYDDYMNAYPEAIKHYTKFLELRPMGEDSRQVRAWIFNIHQEQRIGLETR